MILNLIIIDYCVGWNLQSLPADHPGPVDAEDEDDKSGQYPGTYWTSTAVLEQHAPGNGRQPAAAQVATFKLQHCSRRTAAAADNLW